MSNTHYIQAPFTIVNIDIARDEDWYDPLPQLLDEEGEPVNFTGKTLNLYIRPVYDHSVLIKQLSSPAGGIVIDDVEGYATISVDRSAVITDLPVGDWDQFLVLTQATDPEYQEIWRGRLRVHPGKISV